MANRFSVDTVFRGIDQMSGMYGPMTSKAKAFEKSLKGSVASATDIAAKPLGVLQKVGAVTVAGGVAAGAVLTDLISTGADFEKTMIAAGAKFSPAIRQGTAEFEQLRITAEKVGAETEFNAQQAAAGLKDLASAGFNAKQAIAALPGVVDLATASEVDLSAASEMATKSLGAFNLKTDDAVQLGKNLARVNDVMSRTADATSASMEGLFQSILEGGPVATTAGASVETFMALAGQLAQSGIEASVAGTTLKNVFLTLAAPSKEAAAGLAALDIKTSDAKGNMRDAIAVLGDLEKKVGKMGTAKKAEVLEGIFGKIPIAGVSALLGGGIDKVAALRTELENATGSTARMAAIMRDSTKNDIDGFTSAIDGVKIAIFNVIKAPFRSLTQGVTEWTSANQAFIATKFDEYLTKAIPIVEALGDGISDSFLAAQPVINGVKDALLSVFGGDDANGPRMQAYLLANTVTDVTLVLFGFWAVTKAASAATWAYTAVTKGATAAVWLYQAAASAIRWALLWWEIQSKAGAAATVAMSVASGVSTVRLYAQAAAARVAAVSMGTLAAQAGAAALAIGAVMLAKGQNDALEKETGGKGILDVGWEWMTTDKGLKEIADENLDKQAKAEALARDKAAAAAGSKPAAVDVAAPPLVPPMMSPGGVPPVGMSMPPGMPPVSAPEVGTGPQSTPQVSLKDESTAQLSQNLSRDISSALKGTVKIEIADKSGSAKVNSSTGSGVSVTETGSF